MSAAFCARLRDRLAALARWHRCAVAAALGGLATLAFAPFYALPILAVSFTLLLWMLPPAAAQSNLARDTRRGFVLGWWFGFGHFVAGLYWITNALLVDAAQFGWLVPFAVVGLSAYFALFPGAAVAVAALARPGWPRVLALAGAWGLGEYLRGVLLTGFPWNLMGSALAGWPAPLQGAALAGAYGLSLLVVAVAAAPAVLAEGAAPRRARVVPLAVAGAALVLVWAGGAMRLAGAPAVVAEAADTPRLRIVQGAIDQRLKWHPDELRRHFETYLALSRAPYEGDRAPDAVIWPETAVPYLFDGGPALLRTLSEVAPPGGVLITGVVRSAGRGEGLRLWNAVIAVTRDGVLAATYDKHHLVPFGEYVPLRRFNPVPKLTEGRIDFSPGEGAVTLALPGLPPASPLICYEAIFPAAVVARAAPRPAWLLNVTNDAWFGRSTGPHQHLAAARLRAVEEGLPLIRAANTGISAAIDAYGRELARLGLGVRGTLDVALPPAAAPTPFARHGNLPALIMAAALGSVGMAAVVAAGRRRRRPGNVPY